MKSAGSRRPLVAAAFAALLFGIAVLSPGSSDGYAAGPFRAHLASLAADSVRPAAPPGTSVSAPARYYASAVWDDHHDQMLVYGGLDRAVRSELFAYRPESGTWVQLNSAGGPADGRSSHSAVWDPSGTMIIFGGFSAGPDGLSNEAWAYRSATNAWEKYIVSGTAPARRDNAAAAWDPDNSRMLLFGGKGGDFLMSFGDLWSFDPQTSTWTELHPAIPGPSPRSAASATWDPVGHQLLVFGGWDFVHRGNFDDLWSYRPATNTWQQLAVSGPRPIGRFRHTATWDPSAGEIVVTGGCCGGATMFFNDVWRYSPAHDQWTLDDAASGVVPVRDRHVAVWDTTRDQLLVYGGNGTCFLLNDVWRWQRATNTWSRSGSETARFPLPARYGHVGAWDSVASRVVGTSGCDGSSIQPDTWIANPQTGQWRALMAGPAGLPDAAAGWDAANRALYVFGGLGADDNLWRFDAATELWTLLQPNSERPGGRFDHAAAWDSINGRFLVFGGQGAGFRSDLWAYDPATNAWSQLASAPQARSLVRGTFDASRGLFIVFGGWSQDIGGTFAKTEYDSLLAYDVATDSWRELPSSTAGPSSRFQYALEYDPAGDQLLLFGGFRFSSGGPDDPYVRGDLWRYDMKTGAWHRLEPAGSRPSARFYLLGMWDSAGRRMIIQGGYGEGVLGDIWAYDPAANRWAPLGPGPHSVAP